MAGISSLGIGSGLDINSLLSRLMQAERAPSESRLNKREATFRAQLSAYGTVKSAMSEFKSALDGLKNLSSFQGRTATSSDTGIVTATSSTSAITGSYGVEVTQLAQSHTLYSGTFTNTTDVVGQGTLTFRFGTTVYTQTPTKTYTSFTPNSGTATHTVTIDSTSNTLAGIRDAVNKAGIGVQASIINDGTGNRLVFNSSHTGANYGMEVVVNDNDGIHTDTNNLSRLAFNSAAANLDQSRAAQSATLNVNGLPITSAVNTGISGVIEGLILNLGSAQTGKTVTVTVGKDTAAVSKALDNFVKAYNSLQETIKSVSAYDTTTGKGATLTGDAAVRGIAGQVRSELNKAVSDLGGLTGLADIGIKSTADGKLSLDSAKLQTAMNNNFDNLGYLFAAGAKSSDGQITYKSATDKTQVGNYSVNVTQVATQGKYTGAAASSLVVNADNDTLSIKVDGTQSGTITLTQKTYSTNAELAAELQSRINGDSVLSAAGISVAVTYSAGSYVFTSNRYGSASDVEIAANDTTSAATLGIGTAVGSHAAGVDVAGSMGGSDATGSGRVLTGTGNAQGLALEVSGGSTGDRGTVTFFRGVADRLSTLLDNILGSNGSVEARTKGLNDRIEDIASQREALERRLADVERRYRAQFTALDGLVTQMQSTSAYLTQQLANLPGASKQK